MMTFSGLEGSVNAVCIATCVDSSVEITILLMLLRDDSLWDAVSFQGRGQNTKTNLLGGITSSKWSIIRRDAIK